MSTPIKIGIIGGSGLDDSQIIEARSEKVVTTYFGNPSDVLIEGKIAGVDCVLLSRHGRNHSIMPSNVNYRANIWAMKSLGCTHLIVSTATGSLQEKICPGDIVIPDNFIDRTTKRTQTFYDGNELLVGVCHIPMEPAFCSRTREILIETAKELGIGVHDKGTVVTIEGPRFSSKGESNLFRQWGADLVNMTLVPEVVLAKEAGLCYAAIAMATDYDCWRDSGEIVNVADVMSTFKKNVTKVTELITTVIPKIAAIDWTETIEDLKNVVNGSIMLPHSE
ncbi:S-methyl-5'-thioadenosine phosphorylase [Topomyia yanbarensis]|uniref:S-methyl-5'-thioadenosine phosphorylase n=1 Tax=Topomyia yanbarensis TaxID=2498891 RepID=UPI00273ADFCC|nr:S-methyl-5'-thioadenosine phosphorylase [Topomyia yanbarensis]